MIWSPGATRMLLIVEEVCSSAMSWTRDPRAPRRRRVDADPRYSLGSASTKYNPPAIKIVTGRVKTQAMTMREIMP